MSGLLEQGLVNVLSGTVTARPVLPQPAVYPVARYQLIHVSRETSVDGLSAGVTEATMQIDCMSDSYSGAKTLADSVRGVLNRYAGQWGETTSPETHLIARLVLLQTENDFNEIDGDQRIYWVSQRYSIWTNMD